MAKSVAFPKIKADILRAVARVPPGRVSTFADVGAFLEIMPRHVAYVLATLSEEERKAIPWHRIVMDGGRISPTRFSTRGRDQIRRLQAEGAAVSGRKLDAFARVRHSWPSSNDVPGRRTRGRYLDPTTGSRFDEPA